MNNNRRGFLVSLVALAIAPSLPATKGIVSAKIFSSVGENGPETMAAARPLVIDHFHSRKIGFYSREDIMRANGMFSVPVSDVKFLAYRQFERHEIAGVLRVSMEKI